MREFKLWCNMWNQARRTKLVENEPVKYLTPNVMLEIQNIERPDIMASSISTFILWAVRSLLIEESVTFSWDCCSIIVVSPPFAVLLVFEGWSGIRPLALQPSVELGKRNFEQRDLVANSLSYWSSSSSRCIGKARAASGVLMVAGCLEK